MSIAKTDGTAGTCTECWCLVEQYMERAHEEWHQKQNEILDRTLRAAGAALDDAARLRMTIAKMQGRAP